MQNIGKILRDARLQNNNSIEELHEQTRIVKEHLKQLEQNDFSFLPETYVKSFLKIYAEALRLDSEQILDKYEENIREERRLQKELDQTSTEQTALEPRRRFIEWSLGFASVVLLIALIFGYMQYKSQIQSEPITKTDSQRYSANSLADVEFEKSQSDSFGYRLRIEAKEKIWLHLTIDGKGAEEHMLVPQQVMSSKAQSRFEVVIGRIETKDIVSTSGGLTGKNGDAVSLTFSGDVSIKN